MYGELYQYLILYKQLNVPGVGTFLLERKPAIADFPNKQILPPSFTVTLQQAVVAPSKHFFNWLAASLKLSDRDAVVRFNDFAFDIKRQLSDGNRIEWNGIGTLTKGFGEEIRFEPQQRHLITDSPVIANKVIREKAEHTVRVGEEEKTSTQMLDYLSHAEEKKNYWWAGAVALGIAAIIFIGWYFSTHGLTISSSGNGQKLKPAVSEQTYKRT